MAVRPNPLLRTARGVATVARRRGVGYFGYLLGGVAWPRAAYRFGWGPGAPLVLQGVFAAAGDLAAEKPSEAELALHRLTAGGEHTIRATDATAAEIERLMDRAHAAGIAGVWKSFRKVRR